MNPRLLVSSSVVALFLLACGGGSSPRPDGGVAVCDPNEEKFLVVTVVDASGQPAGGATISALNVSTGQRVTAVANDQGVSTAIGTSIGSGTITVSATLANKASNTQQAQFTCGECGCNIEPDSVTITLNP